VRNSACAIGALLAIVSATSARAAEPGGVPAEAAFVLDAPQLSEEPNMRGEVDASWEGAKRLQLDWDFAYQRDPRDQTAVYVAVDPRGIDVAFVAQADAITARSTRTTRGTASTTR